MGCFTGGRCELLNDEQHHWEPEALAPEGSDRSHQTNGSGNVTPNRPRPQSTAGLRLQLVATLADEAVDDVVATCACSATSRANNRPRSS